MKQKFKNYLKLGMLLFGISFVLTNCQKDDFDNINEEALNKNGYSVNRLTEDEVKSNEKLINKLEHIKNRKTTYNNASSREVYNSEYDFTIETDEVIYIEKEAYHSYTFQIFRNEDTEVKENLLLSLQNDGSYKASIIEYSNIETELLKILWLIL